MYICRRSWHECMKKPTLAAFLKHNAEWDAEWSSNLYFSKVSWMQLFPQNGSYSNAEPPLMWHKNAAMSNIGWWKWNDSIRPVILCPCALNNSIFQSLQRLVDNICSRYGLLTAFTEHSLDAAKLTSMGTNTAINQLKCKTKTLESHHAE